MKQKKINYVPWVVKIIPGALPQPEERTYPITRIGGGPGLETEIYEAIRKWKRFPVEYGEGAEASAAVYVLLDRIDNPLRLLSDPRLRMVSVAERCKPAELPRQLGELFERLQALGHAE